MVLALQKENAGLRGEILDLKRALKTWSDGHVAGYSSLPAAPASESRSQSSDKDDVSFDATVALKNSLDLERANHQATKKKLTDTLSRVDKYEFDTRNMAADQLLIKAHEIKKDTRMLILTTKHKSLINAATYANLTNRLQNICTGLDAIVMLFDDVEVEQLTLDTAAKEHNVVPVPWKQDWEDPQKKQEILENIKKLFDNYSKDKYSLQ